MGSVASIYVFSPEDLEQLRAWRLDRPPPRARLPDQ
jgi:hypothetical protein